MIVGYWVCGNECFVNYIMDYVVDVGVLVVVGLMKVCRLIGDVLNKVFVFWGVGVGDMVYVGIGVLFFVGEVGVIVFCGDGRVFCARVLLLFDDGDICVVDDFIFDGVCCVGGCSWRRGGFFVGGEYCCVDKGCDGGMVYVEVFSEMCCLGCFWMGDVNECI